MVPKNYRLDVSATGADLTMMNPVKRVKRAKNTMDMAKSKGGEVGITNQDAVKWLENLKQDIGQMRHAYLWPYAEAIDEIVELLETQEAVKPIMKQEMDDICSCFDNIAYCGKCGAYIGRLKENYCSNCGQAVEWPEPPKEFGP